MPDLARECPTRRREIRHWHPSRDRVKIGGMSDTTYITRSDLEDAFAQFRDETATLVADVVADRLREFRGGNGLPPTPHSDSAPTKTLESDAALILQGIAALSEAAALTRSEVGELKAGVSAVKADVAAVKTDVAEAKIDLMAEMAEVKTELRGEMADLKAELKLEVADVKTENRSTREALEATAELIRNEIATEHAELRTDMVREVSKVSENVRELQAATRTVKWLFSLLAAATLGILTMFHQDLGRRIDGVRAELHASISEVRTDLSGLRDNMVDVFDRLVRIETIQRTGAPDNPPDLAADNGD